ncbi:MAG TPA: hypothetical protein DIW34_03685 [Oribacterium sp.]|nr:hypothetical protein [Oribacterium sp.]
MNNKTIHTLNWIWGDGVFSDHEVNTGRQIELDIAKGFAILFMIWVHTAETFSAGTGLGYAIVDNFLGGPFAAPVFMVCMGIGMRYGRKTSAKDFAKRGIELLVIGLMLNVFRYVLPLLIGYALSGETLFLNTFTFLFGVDILEFAGLAFLFFALAKKLKWKDHTLLIIAAAASVLGALLTWTDTGNMYIDQFTGYIWGNDDAQTYFPFLNWIIFPVFGYLFAKGFRHLADKKTFYRKTSIICGVLGLGYLIAAYVFSFSFGMYGENGYYYFLGPIDTIAVLMLVVGIFGFDYLMLPMQHTRFMQALRDMSKNINTVYCIQWTLIGVTGILLGGVLFPESGLTFMPMTLLAAAVAGISGFTAHWYQNRKFLKTKPGKIVLSCILIAVTIISLIGQTQAAPLDLFDEYGYAASDSAL